LQHRGAAGAAPAQDDGDSRGHGFERALHSPFESCLWAIHVVLRLVRAAVKDRNLRIGGRLVKWFSKNKSVDIRARPSINTTSANTRVFAYFAYDITEW
jgi:hypothetical protein